MSIIIRLQNLPLSATSLDIRNFFQNLSIPDGGVHIVGGKDGDAFIYFSSDEDGRLGMQKSGEFLKDTPVKLLLSSRNEMAKVIEQARSQNQGSSTSTSSITPSPATTSALSNAIPEVKVPLHQQQTSIWSNVSAEQTPIIIPTTPSAAGNNISNPNQNANAFNMQMAAAVQNQNPNQLLSNISQMQGGFPNIFGFPNIPNQMTPQQLQQQQQMGLPTTIPQQQQQQQIPPNLQQQPFGLMSGQNFPVDLFQQQQQQLQQQQQQQQPRLPIPPNQQQQQNLNPFMFNLTQHQQQQQQQQQPQHQLGSMFQNQQSMMVENQNQTGNPFMVGSQIGQMGLLGAQPQGIRPNIMSNNSNVGGGPGPTGGGQIRGQIRGIGDRPPFNIHNQQNQQSNRDGDKSFGGGRHQNAPAALSNFRDNQVSSRERDVGPREKYLSNKRSRSKSRDKIRDKDMRGEESRRRRSSRDRESRRPSKRSTRSRSRSRTRSGDRSVKSFREKIYKEMDSRRKSDREEGETSSPEKMSSQERESSSRERKDSHDMRLSTTSGSSREGSAVPSSTTEEHNCILLKGVPKDSSFREIREFVRVDLEGGSESVLREYIEGLAYVKIANAKDYPRVFRQNGRKIRNYQLTVEPYTIDQWDIKKKMLDENPSPRVKDKERDRDHRRSKRSSSVEVIGHHRRNSRFSAGNCLKLSGLPPAVVEKDLVSRLLVDLTFQDLIIIPSHNQSGRAEGTAYIHFENAQVANVALEQIKNIPEGANLHGEFCELDQFPKRGSGGRDFKPGGGLGDAKPLFDLEFDTGLIGENTSTAPKKTIFTPFVKVIGFPPEISDRDVVDFFSDIGLIPKEIDNRGQFVICEFPDTYKSKRATQKDGMMFGRNRVAVKLYHPNQPNKVMRPASSPGLGGGFNNGPRMNNINNNNNAGMFGGMNPRGMNPRFQNQMPFNNNNNNNNFQNGPRPPRMRMPGGNNRPPSRFDRPNNGNNNGNNGNNGGGGGGMDGMDQLFCKPGCVLGLENVPFKASMDDILNYLEEVLKIRISSNRIIRRFNEFQKPTGDARIAFETPFEAKLALDRIQGTSFWKREIFATQI